MADFRKAIDQLIEAEGGYKLTDIKDDAGGQTYAGISRSMNPQWAGWGVVDKGKYPDKSLVHEFYKSMFWERVSGDEITDQDIAYMVFSFAVNGGEGTARRLAQVAAKVDPDGLFGPETINAINSVDAELFALRFFAAKVSRYAAIVNKNRTQGKFLLGWINRTLRELI